MTAKLPTYVRNDRFTGKGRVSNWGSREHFHHFLLGYLLPVVGAQMHHRFDKFLALDCGPTMTPILEETLQRLGYQFEIVSPDGIEEPSYLQPWDYAWKSADAVHAAVKNVRIAWQDYECAQRDCVVSDNLLIERSAPPEYYTQGGAEIRGYGTGRRRITNWPEVCEHLDKCDVPYTLYEPGSHCLGCQIAAFSGARRIVGMRGAEWANVIWAKPGLRVRVVDPSPPARILTRFFDRMDVHYEFAIAERSHVPEQPGEVARFFTREDYEPGPNTGLRSWLRKRLGRS